MSRENLIKDQGIFSSVIISNKSGHKHKTTLRTEGVGGLEKYAERGSSLRTSTYWTVLAKTWLKIHVKSCAL